MGRLDNRVAVITGGAKGLGRAAALRLASEGAQIGIVDMSDAGETVAEVKKAGGVAEAWKADTTDEDQVNETFQKIGRRFGGRIDILVNNAGILAPRKAWNEWTKKDLAHYAEVNYLGYFNCTKAAYPFMKGGEHGRVINVASRTFFMGNPGQLPYVASKGAVTGLTWNLAKELGEDGITVNAVMPGMVPTEGSKEINPGDEIFERLVQGQAIKKQVMPEDLAGLIAFLASDDAALITGQSIIMDGGGYLH
jgi:NAD(P)-dependent dehydrogenase (short-subunit alcohol dehydrogenase family)